MDYSELLADSGLKYSNDETPGYRRKKYGKGFIYIDELDQKITDKKILKRIKSIGIPPMWRDVWICKSRRGHIQATGRDSLNRKQYLYHETWTTIQQENKFHKLIEFGQALPAIRKAVRKDLEKKSWPKKKVLALVIAILDETYIRIGNRYYYETNGTLGLTTLRRKNLEVNGQSITFKYKAKSNKFRELKISNKRLIRLIRQCSELRGYEVFRYLENSGQTVPIDSSDVNDYLRDISGENFTTKNFRTWGGTVLAIRKFKTAKEKVEGNRKLKLRRAIVKEVAKELNNTIAVCEKYYIHPAVLSALDETFNPETCNMENIELDLTEEEKTVLAIIRSGQ